MIDRIKIAPCRAYVDLRFFNNLATRPQGSIHFGWDRCTKLEDSVSTVAIPIAKDHPFSLFD